MAFRKYCGGDEFFILLEGTLIDGLGYLNRLQKRAGEFEGMAIDVLGASHPFGFFAGLISVGKGESFASANARVSKALCISLDPTTPTAVYWNRAETSAMRHNSFAEKIVSETDLLFKKQ